jgi:MFS transporter, ACS family, solute carrier family 17 (sodium-dependent inorganic phosphate cotransporter), other
MPARYVFAVLGSVGFAIIYGLKVNLSVCIVAMVNNTALTAHPSQDNTTLQLEAGEFCTYPTEELHSASSRKGDFEVSLAREPHCFK